MGAGNSGIILAANWNASTNHSQLPTNGNLNSPLSVDVSGCQRVVATVAFSLGNGGVTSYAFTFRLTNNGLFLALAASGAPVGSAFPGVGSSGAVDANLNVPMPIESVAQNGGGAPGILQVTQTYTTGANDIIMITGALVGLLDVQLACLTAPAAGDFATVSLNLL